MAFDVNELLDSLHDELRRINAAIASVEAIRTGDEFHPDRPRNSRGRKSMGSDERLAVSERMKRHWAERRGDGKAS